MTNPAAVRFHLKELRQFAQDYGVETAKNEALARAEAALLFYKETTDEERLRMCIEELVDQLKCNDYADVIAWARTPEYWSAKLEKAGIAVSAEEIRERTVAARMYFRFGDQILLLPDHIDVAFHARQIDPPPRPPKESEAFRKALARFAKPRRKPGIQPPKEPAGKRRRRRGPRKDK